MFEFFPTLKGFAPDLGTKVEKWTSTCFVGKRNPQKDRSERRGSIVLVVPLL